MKTRYFSIALFFGLFINQFLSKAQNTNQEICHPGPIGIFVSGGKFIPNGIKIQSITIERKEGNGEYKKITDLISPKTESEFLTKVKDAAKYFPDFEFPDEKKLIAIWNKSKYGQSDSLGYWGKHPAVKMALGILFYDMDVSSKNAYQYKISSGEKISESKFYQIPYHPEFDELHFHSSWYNKDGLTMKWYSTGKKPANGLKVFTYNSKKEPIEAKTTILIQPIKDTTFYFVIEKQIVSGTERQYSVLGIDQYENASLNPAQAIISSDNVQSLFFKKTNCERLKNQLGVKLFFKLNDTRNVGSIHLYKSQNNGNKYEELSIISAQDSTYIDEHISPDKIYYYYFIAYDKQGVPLKKSNVVFSYAMDQRAPLNPTIQYIKPIKNGLEIQFSCQDEYLKSYKIYRKGHDENEYKIIYETLLSDFSKPIQYLDTTSELSGKRIYSYFITVINTSGIESDSSNVLSERPLKTTYPNAPQFINAYYQDRAIHLDWDNSPKQDWTIKGYRLYKKYSNEQKSNLVFHPDTILETNRFNDTVFEYGKNYEYAIETIDQFGNISKEKAIVQVSTPSNQINPPGGLKAIKTPSEIVLEWEKVEESNLKHYVLYRYQRGQAPIKLATLNPDQLNFMDKSAKNNELYFYYVISVDTKNQESKPGEEIGVRK